MELNVTQLTDRNDILGTYDIYKHCMYKPTEEKFKTKADTYLSNDSVKINACMQDTEIKGVIIISFLEQYKVEIIGIAVAESARNQGIGSYMINKLVDEYSLISVFSETDKDAVDFYRKNGFDITEFFQKYGGETIVRYKCRLEKNEVYGGKIMEYMFETEHLRIRKYKLEDTQCLYENHLEEEVKKWIPNESYADIEETQGAIKFYVDCVNNRHGISVIYGCVMHGNNASVKVLEKNGYVFVKEEFGAEDDPYGKGMLIYRKEY